MPSSAPLVSTPRSHGVLVLGMLALLWWRAGGWFPELPERIPMHFDSGGRPDGWAAKSVGSWFLLPALGTLWVLLLLAISRWVERLAGSHPKWCNLPRKKLFVALSPAGRSSALQPTRRFLLGLGALVVLLFGWIVEGSARVAVGRWTELPSWPLFLFLGAVVVLLVGFVAATSQSIEAAARQEGIL